MMEMTCKLCGEAGHDESWHRNERTAPAAGWSFSDAPWVEIIEHHKVIFLGATPVKEVTKTGIYWNRFNGNISAYGTLYKSAPNFRSTVDSEPASPS